MIMACLKLKLKENKIQNTHNAANNVVGQFQIPVLRIQTAPSINFIKGKIESIQNNLDC